MKKLARRRPSPSLAISLLALFVALGGSAYAASKIGTKDIKANAITAGKIKKNAVTTPKIKNNAVTGAKIKESSLGPVPSATSATTATTATNFVRYQTSGLRKVNAGSDVVLATIGPFTYTGRCKDLGGGNAESFVVLTTSGAGSFFYSEEFGGSSKAEFDPGEEQLVSYENESKDHEWGGYSIRYLSHHAASPDGSVLLDAVVNSGAGVFGADCAFELWWLNGA